MGPLLTGMGEGGHGIPRSFFALAGLIGIADEGSGQTPKRSDTRENAMPANRPVLHVEYTPAPAPCYPNCDHSTIAPILNVPDFSCFLSSFAAGCS